MHVESIKEAMTSTGDDNPMSNLRLTILGAVVAFERSLILERPHEDIAIDQTVVEYKVERRSSLTNRLPRCANASQRGSHRPYSRPRGGYPRGRLPL